MSASGYFQHQRNKQLERSIHPTHSIRMSNEALLVHIKSIYAEVRGKCGWLRMTKALNARGFRLGKELVRKLMQLHGIRAKRKRKFVVTTDNNNRLDDVPDLVQRGFHVE